MGQSSQTRRGKQRPKKDPDKVALGQRIREARHNAGMTQGELSRALDITPGAIGQWEIGLVAPSSTTLTKLPKLLNVSADWLSGLRSPNTETIAVTLHENELLAMFRRLDRVGQETIVKMVRGL